MNQDELKEKILKVIEGKKLAALSNIRDGKPWVRYVVAISRGLNIYVATFKSSRKIVQLEKDNNVHLSIRAHPDDFSLPYVNIVATAKIKTDQETKNDFWDDSLVPYFNTPDNPEYCILEITPSVIEYYVSGNPIPEVYQNSE